MRPAPIAVVVNMSGQMLSGYRLPLPRNGRWREALNSDANGLRRRWKR